MMRQILRIRAIVVVAIKRLLAQRLLTISTIVGLIVAVALILTIPVYSESVAFRLLTERLTADDDQVNRPPFSFLISYIGSWNEPVNIEEINNLDTFVKSDIGNELGLNATQIIRHLETMNLRLYPSGESDYDDEDKSLDYVSFGTTDDIINQIEFVDGVYPAPADPSSDSVVEVMIYEEFATEFGIQAGETYVGFNWRLDANEVLQITEIRVSGIWRPLDPNSPYWFYKPTVFSDIMLVHEDTFINRISTYSEEEVNLGVWYVVTDGKGVNTSRVDELVERHDNTEKRIDQLLEGAYIQASPVDELKPYQRIVSVLTLTLTVFSIPIVALLIVFLVMIVGLVVDGQRNETAVLRSRGTSPFQIVGLATIEGLIMGVIALAIGILLAGLFTQLIGTTRSFMDFNYSSSFLVSYPPTIVSTAGLALFFTVLIRVIPTISASRHTIISYKADRSRLIRRPLWQRLGLDVLLMIVISYFYYQIVQQGALIDVEGGVYNIDQAYDQPFVFLLPALTILAMTLFLLRFLPYLLRFLAWIIQLTNSVGLLIVTRQLERYPGAYYLPLILLISTISLGIYTASFARTIDRYLYEQQFYRVVGDMSVRVFSQDMSLSPDGGDDAPVAYMHISEFTNMESIESATRFGEYSANAKLTSGTVPAKFVGVDRAEFGQVAFWRTDFASIRLGYLLNELALQPDTVLVSGEFMDERGLNEGDFVQVEVKSLGESFTFNLQIVGTVNYFPRWYPEEDGPLFVGNLDYVFEQAQAELPHRIIARVNDKFDKKTFTTDILRRGAAGVLVEEPAQRIEREQTRPERQGLFGLLSIGFLTSSLATMMGFLLYTIFSYKRRYVELGILRAIGLSQSSMIISVAWELGLLILMGLFIGFGIGLAVSWLYIPYMQFVSNLEGIIPPYQVMIAWSEITQIIALFIGTFIVIMMILLATLRRMRIFQAVKLGESL